MRKLSFAVLVLFAGAAALVGHSYAATIPGTITYPTKYVDGTDLPAANIKQFDVQVGTCATTGTSPTFGTVEGTGTIVPPATSYSVTVPRSFGDFCVRSRTVTTLGTVGDFGGAALGSKAEPKPNPPLVTVATVAYEIKLHPLEGPTLGRNVGTVPLGTPCPNPEPIVGTDFYAIPTDAVTLDKNKTPKSAVLVAKCAAG